MEKIDFEKLFSEQFRGANWFESKKRCYDPKLDGAIKPFKNSSEQISFGVFWALCSTFSGFSLDQIIDQRNTGKADYFSIKHKTFMQQQVELAATGIVREVCERLVTPLEAKGTKLSQKLIYRYITAIVNSAIEVSSIATKNHIYEKFSNSEHPYTVEAKIEFVELGVALKKMFAYRQSFIPIENDYKKLTNGGTFKQPD